MWISKRLINKTKNNIAENGRVTMPSSEVSATNLSRDFATYAPYGVSYVLPTGSSVIMVPSAQGEACCGVEMGSTKGMDVGEIKIESKSGAYIYFRSYGTVEINGVEITKDGKIYCTKVEEENFG